MGELVEGGGGHGARDEGWGNNQLAPTAPQTHFARPSTPREGTMAKNAHDEQDAQSQVLARATHPLPPGRP